MRTQPLDGTHDGWGLDHVEIPSSGNKTLNQDDAVSVFTGQNPLGVPGALTCSSSYAGTQMCHCLIGMVTVEEVLAYLSLGDGVHDGGGWRKWLG